VFLPAQPIAVADDALASVTDVNEPATADAGDRADALAGTS